MDLRSEQLPPGIPEHERLDAQGERLLLPQKGEAIRVSRVEHQTLCSLQHTMFLEHPQEVRGVVSVAAFCLVVDSVHLGLESRDHRVSHCASTYVRFALQEKQHGRALIGIAFGLENTLLQCAHT